MSEAGKDDRRRILGLLEAGEISADEAAELLEALRGFTAPPTPPAPPEPKGVARGLRVSINASDAADASTVNFSVPIALAKFAGKFIPRDAKAQVEKQGVDLTELLGSLDSDLPPGPLLNVKAGEGAEEVTITIEVV